MRRALLAAFVAALLSAGPAEAWTWPVAGPVLQPFAYDPAHPYAAGQHRGIDIGADAGEAVVAPAAGTVTFAGSVPGSGRSVTIATADGYAVTLTHLGSVTATKGAPPAEGDGVGTIGPSDETERPQPYLQLGIRVAAEAQGYLDPLSFLPPRPQPPSPAAPAPTNPVAAAPTVAAAGSPSQASTPAPVPAPAPTVASAATPSAAAQAPPAEQAAPSP